MHFYFNQLNSVMSLWNSSVGWGCFSVWVTASLLVLGRNSHIWSWSISLPILVCHVCPCLTNLGYRCSSTVACLQLLITQTSQCEGWFYVFIYSSSSMLELHGNWVIRFSYMILHNIIGQCHQFTGSLSWVCSLELNFKKLIDKTAWMGTFFVFKFISFPVII